MTPPRSGTCCLRSDSSSRSDWATRISNRFEPRTASTDGPRFDSWSGGDRLPASRAHASNGSSGEPDRTRGSGASSIVRRWRSPVECACRLFRRETSYCSSCSPAAPRTPGTWSSCWPVRIATRRSPRRPAGPVPGALAPDCRRPDRLRSPGSAGRSYFGNANETSSGTSPPTVSAMYRVPSVFFVLLYLPGSPSALVWPDRVSDRAAVVGAGRRAGRWDGAPDERAGRHAAGAVDSGGACEPAPSGAWAHSRFPGAVCRQR